MSADAAAADELRLLCGNYQEAPNGKSFVVLRSGIMNRCECFCDDVGFKI
jgi:hypothetical protein